jgi:hypothetical protein
MKLDRWDGVGAAGAVLIGAGVWGLTRVWWALVFWGLVLLALYMLREMRQGGR